MIKENDPKSMNLKQNSSNSNKNLQEDSQKLAEILNLCSENVQFQTIQHILHLSSLKNDEKQKLEVFSDLIMKISSFVQEMNNKPENSSNFQKITIMLKLKKFLYELKFLQIFISLTAKTGQITDFSSEFHNLLFEFKNELTNLLNFLLQFQKSSTNSNLEALESLIPFLELYFWIKYNENIHKFKLFQSKNETQNENSISNEIFNDFLFIINQAIDPIALQNDFNEQKESLCLENGKSVENLTAFVTKFSNFFKEYFKKFSLCKKTGKEKEKECKNEEKEQDYNIFSDYNKKIINNSPNAIQKTKNLNIFKQFNEKNSNYRKNLATETQKKQNFNKSSSSSLVFSFSEFEFFQVWRFMITTYNLLQFSLFMHHKSNQISNSEQKQQIFENFHSILENEMEDWLDFFKKNQKNLQNESKIEPRFWNLHLIERTTRFHDDFLAIFDCFFLFSDFNLKFRSEFEDFGEMRSIFGLLDSGIKKLLIHSSKIKEKSVSESPTLSIFEKILKILNNFSSESENVLTIKLYIQFLCSRYYFQKKNYSKALGFHAEILGFFEKFKEILEKNEQKTQNFGAEMTRRNEILKFTLRDAIFSSIFMNKLKIAQKLIISFTKLNSIPKPPQSNKMEIEPENQELSENEDTWIDFLFQISKFSFLEREFESCARILSEILQKIVQKRNFLNFCCKFSSNSSNSTLLQLDMRLFFRLYVFVLLRSHEINKAHEGIEVAHQIYGQNFENMTGITMSNCDSESTEEQNEFLNGTILSLLETEIMFEMEIEPKKILEKFFSAEQEKDEFFLLKRFSSKNEKNFGNRRKRFNELKIISANNSFILRILETLCENPEIFEPELKKKRVSVKETRTETSKFHEICEKLKKFIQNFKENEMFSLNSVPSSPLSIQNLSVIVQTNQSSISNSSNSSISSNSGAGFVIMREMELCLTYNEILANLIFLKQKNENFGDDDDEYEKVCERWLRAREIEIGQSKKFYEDLYAKYLSALIERGTLLKLRNQSQLSHVNESCGLTPETVSTLDVEILYLYITKKKKFEI